MLVGGTAAHFLVRRVCGACTACNAVVARTVPRAMLQRANVIALPGGLAKGMVLITGRAENFLLLPWLLVCELLSQQSKYATVLS